MESKPIIVLITSKECGHCLDFRGSDGIPSSTSDISGHYKPLNYVFLNRLICRNSFDKGSEKRVSRLLEINVHTLSNSQNNIDEFNEYRAIPALEIIDEHVRQHGFDHIDDFIYNYVPTSSERYYIGRFSVVKKNGDIPYFACQVEGVESELLTEIHEYLTIWQRIPNAYLVYKKIKSGQRVESTEIRNLPHDIKQVVESTSSILNSKSEFKSVVFRLYNFAFIKDSIFCPTVRYYEQFYPCWMMVSEDEWEMSVSSKARPVFARVINHVTKKVGNKYRIDPFTKSENIDTLLNSYEEGNILLSYVETNKVKRPWEV